MSEEQTQHTYYRARCGFIEASRTVGYLSRNLRENHVIRG